MQQPREFAPHVLPVPYLPTVNANKQLCVVRPEFVLRDYNSPFVVTMDQWERLPNSMQRGAPRYGEPYWGMSYEFTDALFAEQTGRTLSARSIVVITDGVQLAGNIGMRVGWYVRVLVRTEDVSSGERTDGCTPSKAGGQVLWKLSPQRAWDFYQKLKKNERYATSSLCTNLSPDYPYHDLELCQAHEPRFHTIVANGPPAPLGSVVPTGTCDDSLNAHGDEAVLLALDANMPVPFASGLLALYADVLGRWGLTEAPKPITIRTSKQPVCQRKGPSILDILDDDCMNNIIVHALAGCVHHPMKHVMRRFVLGMRQVSQIFLRVCDLQFAHHAYRVEHRIWQLKKYPSVTCAVNLSRYNGGRSTSIFQAIRSCPARASPRDEPELWLREHVLMYFRMTFNKDRGTMPPAAPVYKKRKCTMELDSDSEDMEHVSLSTRCSLRLQNRTDLPVYANMDSGGEEEHAWRIEQRARKRRAVVLERPVAESATQMAVVLHGADRALPRVMYGPSRATRRPRVRLIMKIPHSSKSKMSRIGWTEVAAAAHAF